MTQSDIIVIGGGMAGVSAAAELAVGARVRLIEAEPQIGYHSTGRSAAMFIRNYGNATLRALNDMAAPFFDAPEGVSDSSLLSPRGELLIASEDELPEIERFMDGAKGIDRLGADEAVEMVPILAAERIAAAVYEADAQDIDVDRMLQGYARLYRSRGGEMVVDAQVTGLRRVAGLWEVEAGGETYRAPVVVNAAGAWAGQVSALAGAMDIGLVPKRRSAAILPAPEVEGVRGWPVFASISETWYAKPEAGQLLVSPADADPVEPHDAWPDDMVLAEGLHRFECAVTIPVTRVIRSWAGLRSFVADMSPVVGFDPGLEGFFWLAGQGGYGIQTAPALSRIAAGLVCGEAPADRAVLDALAPARLLA